MFRRFRKYGRTPSEFVSVVYVQIRIYSILPEILFLMNHFVYGEIRSKKLPIYTVLRIQVLILFGRLDVWWVPIKDLLHMHRMMTFPFLEGLIMKEQKENRTTGFFQKKMSVLL